MGSLRAVESRNLAHGGFEFDRDIRVDVGVDLGDVGGKRHCDGTKCPVLAGSTPLGLCPRASLCAVARPRISGLHDVSKLGLTIALVRLRSINRTFVRINPGYEASTFSCSLTTCGGSGMSTCSPRDALASPLGCEPKRLHPPNQLNC